MRRAFRRQAAPPRAQTRMQMQAFRSPTKGWVTNTNLAGNLQGAAIVMDNWIPTQSGITVRGGFQEYADVGSDTVLSLFTYRISGVSKLFAADESKIYDITSTPSTGVTGQTSGYYSVQQMETGGGNYMYAVNGTDSARLYDGSTWTAITGISTPAITGVTTSTLSAVWAFKNRLYFVQTGTMVAWYLGIDSIGGAANDMTLRGVFQRGGSLLFGATWSTDAGDGIDDYCVFVSDKGEVAVYSGDDPSASNWSLNGRYDIGGAPLGKNAFTRSGGDLIIATTDGLVPLSAVLQKDAIALSLAAVSLPIEKDWHDEALARITLPWEIERWPQKNMAVITNPVVDSTTAAQCFIVNLETGAWARWTGIAARCFANHNETIYFGSTAGKVFIMQSEGNDDGAVYTAKVAWHFADMGAPGAFKTAMQARAVFRSSVPFTPQLSCSVDYGQSFPSPPSSVSDTTVSTWDSGLWDTVLWDGSTEATTTTTRWVSVNGAGSSHAPQVQITCGTTPVPDAELMVMHLTYNTGDVVV